MNTYTHTHTHTCTPSAHTTHRCLRCVLGFKTEISNQNLVSTRKTFEGQRERGWAWGLLWVGRVTSWLSCSSCLIPATESGDAWESFVSLFMIYACVFSGSKSEKILILPFASFCFIYLFFFLITDECRGLCVGWKRISRHEAEWKKNKVC